MNPLPVWSFGGDESTLITFKTRAVAWGFKQLRLAKPGEIAAIWPGKDWTLLVDGEDCRPFDAAFRPEEKKVSDKNYGRGGGLVYVCGLDADAFRRRGLLSPFYAT